MWKWIKNLFVRKKRSNILEGQSIAIMVKDKNNTAKVRQMLKKKNIQVIFNFDNIIYIKLKEGEDLKFIEDSITVSSDLSNINTKD